MGGGTYQVIEALKDRLDIVIKALNFNPRFTADLLTRVQQARCEAGGSQGSAVIDRQEKAHQRLAVDESDQGVADDARLAADRVERLARQVGIDLRHHCIPVAQQKEGDDRRHDDQRNDVEDREAASDHPLHQAGEPGQRFGQLRSDEIP